MFNDQVSITQRMYATVHVADWVVFSSVREYE